MKILLDFLEKSEKESPEINFKRQAQHFEKLVSHARQTVPFYQQFYENCDIEALPILTRDHIQEAGNNMVSNDLPSSHGRLYPLCTSGTTGKPVNIFATDFTRLFYDALMLREHRWHQRNFLKTLMSIRWERRGFGMGPIGHLQSSWGAPISHYHKTGPSIFINVATLTYDQIEAILYYQPHHINSYPSQLAALADHCLENNIKFDFLEEIRTTGETFTDSYKNLIKQAWPQVKITDAYSTIEAGIIAQQCAEFGNYHINTENVIVEIVDEKGEACAQGQPGSLLLTVLLNYATPLIRYDVGDSASWGSCECGLSLPVIHKILGRKRNRLILPTGESMFPYLGEREDRVKITNAIRKFQIVQHTLDKIEYKVISTEILTPSQEQAIKSFFQKSLGYPFEIIISYHDHIPAGPTGKYEEFISFVAS